MLTERIFSWQDNLREIWNSCKFEDL